MFSKYLLEFIYIFVKKINMLSFQEIIVVLLAILLLFGSKKIPEFARILGKGIHEFKKALDDVKSEINNNSGDIEDDINNIKKDLAG